MNDESAPADKGNEIPEDAIVLKQVQYAWLWSSLPWLVVLGVIYYTDFLIEPVPIIGAAITVVILLPRYIGWRRTAYILTGDGLIYQRGGMTGTQRYQIPWSNLKGARARYGNFGRALGYQSVELLLENGSIARLTYLPILADVAGQIQELIDAVQPDDEEAEDNGEVPEEPRPGDSDASE